KRLTHAVERAYRIGVGEGAAGGTQGGGDPVGVAVGAGGAHCVVGDGLGLVDSPEGGQVDEHADQSGDVRQSGQDGEAGVDIQRLRNLSGEQVGDGLSTTADPGLERVVVLICREGDRRVGVPDGVVRAPDLRADAGGGVKARESTHVGGGGGV